MFCHTIFFKFFLPFAWLLRLVKTSFLFQKYSNLWFFPQDFPRWIAQNFPRTRHHSQHDSFYWFTLCQFHRLGDSNTMTMTRVHLRVVNNLINLSSPAQKSIHEKVLERFFFRIRNTCPVVITPDWRHTTISLSRFYRLNQLKRAH